MHEKAIFFQKKPIPLRSKIKKRMYKPLLYILLMYFLYGCQSQTAEQIEVPKTEKGDQIIYITTINSANDTLFQIENASKGTLQIFYKGDSIMLLKDSTGNDFSNKNHTLTEQNGETTLMQKGKVIFQLKRLPQKHTDNAD
jgi:hypothetical protein